MFSKTSGGGEGTGWLLVRGSLSKKKNLKMTLKMTPKNDSKNDSKDDCKYDSKNDFPAPP